MTASVWTTGWFFIFVSGKKPQKPPRPLLPKLLGKELVAETVPTNKKAGINATLPTNTEDQSDPKLDVKQASQAVSTHTCSRSVTVHWDTPTKHPSAPAEPEPGRRPVPLPRIKSRKQAITEDVQPLVKLCESSDSNSSDPQEVLTNEYLKELLEAFSEDRCEENCDTVNQSEEASQGEDAGAEMNGNNSQRNIRARIQAFESQANAEVANVVEPAKPQLPTRKPSVKPPVAAKPSVTFRPQLSNSLDNTSDGPPKPAADPRPQPPKKPVQSIKDELEALHSKLAVPNKSFPPVLTRANAVDSDPSETPVPPAPLAKPFREPLKPNLNINNHNSASLFPENEYVNFLSGN